MKKIVKDLKKGDVIKVEYGIEDNWVTVELLEDIKFENDAWKYHVRYFGSKNSEPFVMYGLKGYEAVEVIANA